MTTTTGGGTGRRPRSDARRNEEALLDAAAAAFTESGVDAPVRDIAARAGVGLGTVYRHFPTRADLVVAVYRHQIDALVARAESHLAEEPTPYTALLRWVDGFVDFLVTKHGLSGALSQGAAFETLHAYFLERLVPAGAELLAAAVQSGEIVRPGVEAYALLRAIGNLCIGDTDDDRYDTRVAVELLLAGLTVATPPMRSSTREW